MSLRCETVMIVRCCEHTVFKWIKVKIEDLDGGWVRSVVSDYVEVCTLSCRDLVELFEGSAMFTLYDCGVVVEQGASFGVVGGR